jgi:hypothetical protein
VALYQTTLVEAALLDLRANLEAKFRILMAVESRVAGFRHHADPIALQEASKQLDDMRKLHAVTTELVSAVDGALAAYIDMALPPHWA